MPASCIPVSYPHLDVSKRQIEACSDEGDICADVLAGSGTLGTVCQKTGRNWIMCDQSSLAAASQIERVGALKGGSFVVEREHREGCEEALGKPEVSVKLKGGEGPVAVTLDRYRLPVGGLVTAEDRGDGGGEVQAEGERYLADDPLLSLIHILGRELTILRALDDGTHTSLQALSSAVEFT